MSKLVRCWKVIGPNGEAPLGNQCFRYPKSGQWTQHLNPHELRHCHWGYHYSPGKDILKWVGNLDQFGPVRRWVYRHPQGYTLVADEQDRPGLVRQKGHARTGVLLGYLAEVEPCQHHPHEKQSSKRVTCQLRVLRRYPITDRTLERVDKVPWSYRAEAACREQQYDLLLKLTGAGGRYQGQQAKKVH